MVWQNDGTGLAFDPAVASWRVLPPLDVPLGPDGPFSLAATAGGELAVLAADPVTGQGRLALLGDDGWRWDAETLPLPVGDETTLASAGDWLVVLSPVGSPAVYHVPSGRWDQDADGPAVQAPNTVWTEDQLVVWGGVDPGLTSAAVGSDGTTDMVWTPPVAG